MPLQSPAPAKHQETQKVTLNHFYPLFFLLILSRADLSSASPSRQEPNWSRRAASLKDFTTQSQRGNRWDAPSVARGRWRRPEPRRHRQLWEGCAGDAALGVIEKQVTAQAFGSFMKILCRNLSS